MSVRSEIRALLPSTIGNVGKVLTVADTIGTLAWQTAGGGGGGITTLAAIGSSPNANAATISGGGTTLNLEPASASFGGVVTTGAQTFAGSKTFNSPILSGVASGSNALAATAGQHVALSASDYIVSDGFGTLQLQAVAVVASGSQLACWGSIAAGSVQNNGIVLLVGGVGASPKIVVGIPDGTSPLVVAGHTTDGASAVNLVFDSQVAFTTVGSKLISIRNNNVEKAFFDKDGLLNAKSVTLTSGAGGQLTFQDGTTQSTAPVAGIANTGIFGSGNDGNVTVTTSITLTADKWYDTLTVSGSGSIFTNGYRVHCRTKLDLTAAGANAIHNNGDAGADASGTSGGATGSTIPSNSHSIGGGNTGSAGGAGGTGTGSGSGSGATNTGGTGFGQQNGGTSNVTTAVGGSGSTGGSGTGSTPAASFGVWPTPLGIQMVAYSGSGGTSAPTVIWGGGGGAGGPGGGGNGTLAGGGGGGGGCGAGCLFVAAKTIDTGSNATASLISARGGNGGAGGTQPGSPGAGTGVGGGAGGNSGGGGWIMLAFITRVGSTVTNGVDASAGASGVGGTGKANGGTGTGGGGGASAGSGMIEIYNLGSGVTTLVPIGATIAATTNSGSTGGASVQRLGQANL